MRPTYYLSSVAYLAIVCSSSIAQTTFVVRVDGLDGVAAPQNQGSDWGNDAYRYLQDGLIRAQDILDDGETPPNSTVEIWVRGSASNGPIVYRPDQSAADEDGCVCRSATFNLIPNVKLYGGFHNTHTQLSQRLPSYYRTVLTGDTGFQEYEWDNAHHVVTAANSPGSNDLPDCVIDVQDLIFLLDRWGTPGGIAHMAGGTCGDGAVNASPSRGP